MHMQLRQSGDVVWSHGSAAEKWSAITSLSRIHEDLNRTRALWGFGVPNQTKTGSRVFATQRSTAGSVAGSVAVDREVRILFVVHNNTATYY